MTAAVVAVAGGASSAAGASARDLPARHTLTLYTVASGVEFINTADDRVRGTKNNPFAPATDRLRPKVSETGDGPFPGDVAVYSFNVYADAPLKQGAGSASYTCYFNYAKRALCMAYYVLHRGTLVASGPVDFNATGFTLVLTGGTKAYFAARGEVTATAARRNAQRVSILLLG